MRVNKTIYVLLAIFLGGVGIHKFYADKVWQGVFHLVFFWTFIPTIISIIHGIITIFTTKADRYGYIILSKKDLNI
ncbi:TM2 domain-containing protein [Staphylococcus sp. NRL 16/872]|uniref:TM2 domain-containing protein n=1 Tax=Staphylococcus sp. NRL 16/872 TaxID=2930131 RepID=UPI001FB2A5B2|nr:MULTISPECIES: TM2 domain-containing protein [unclassified Staphylococcus]MCJ1656673.1 TM2 domain-containing protein [Staphylococcus sp. NRL 21/187]MCJ1662427.1 TM2 domain-containing protein [Staphylococcus sp. NRL 18/288]MCJ1668517.1 TM2 domain-containing protein [Staphylococcus sp. NRL 19/737]WEN68734.1 TM2 domain-containing protein [Staphylococcus sp. NRL 16/872]